MEQGREQLSRRSEGYIELRDQIMWFNIVATRNRRLHRTLNVLCVLFAVTIPITSFFSAILLAKMGTAILGAMIAFLLMLSLFGNYQVKHLRYRNVAQQLERERRKYLNLTAPYTAGLGENRAFDLFVEKIEQILQEREGV